MTSSSSSDDQRFLELLQRWQSGDFTRQDEQALRNLTESDDFRREAMEGFLALPEAEHTERLAALRRRLGTVRPRTRILALPQMMAMAAALLVLVAAIWFFPRAAEESSAPLAQTSEAAPGAADQAPVLPETETQTSASDAIVQSAPRMRTEEETAATAPARKERPSANQNAPGNDDLAAAREMDQTSPTPPVQEPAATMAAPPPASRPASDPAGDRAAALGKAKSAAKPAAPAADTTDLAWNETDKKSDLTKLQREVRAERSGPAQSEPAEGWAAFSEYLRQNARLTPEARDHNVSGTVRVQFTVNVNGDPQNFIVLRSLGYGCDEEAKRLIRNWNWVRGQNPLVTVEVKFVR